MVLEKISACPMKSFLSFLFHRGDILCNIADVALHNLKQDWNLVLHLLSLPIPKLVKHFNNRNPCFEFTTWLHFTPPWKTVFWL